jgi:hypothetical protein
MRVVALATSHSPADLAGADRLATDFTGLDPLGIRNNGEA